MLKLGLVRYLGYCIYAVGMSVLAECGTPAYACPLFVEFFSDPVDVPDQEGEFIEIRLSDPSEEFAFRAESLLVQFEGKAPLRFEFPQGNLLLLVHRACYPMASVCFRSTRILRNYNCLLILTIGS